VLTDLGVNVAALEAQAGAAAAAVDPRVQAAIDAASRVFVLAKRWDRTGQLDRAEMQAAKDAAAAAAAAVAAVAVAVAVAADAAADAAAVAVAADAAALANAVAYYILQGYDSEALAKLRLLRQKLIDVGVNVAALEVQAGGAAAPAVNALVQAAIDAASRVFVLALGFVRTGQLDRAVMERARDVATSAYSAASMQAGFTTPPSVLGSILGGASPQNMLPSVSRLRDWLVARSVNVAALEAQAGGPIPAVPAPAPAAPAPAPAPAPPPAPAVADMDVQALEMTDAAACIYLLASLKNRMGIYNPAEMQAALKVALPAAENVGGRAAPNRTKPFVAARAAIEVAKKIGEGREATREIAKLREKLVGLGIDASALDTHERRSTPRTPGWAKSTDPRSVGAPRGMNRNARGWEELRRAAAQASTMDARDRDKILDWADGFRPVCPEIKYDLRDGGPNSYAVRVYFRDPAFVVVNGILEGREAEARAAMPFLRDNAEDGDIDSAVRDRARRVLPIAEPWERTGQADRAAMETIRNEYLADPEKTWYFIGDLKADRGYHGRSYFTSGWSVVKIRRLVKCDGLGNKMYQLAADEACRRGTVLGGSSTRSPFSESFWKKQIAEDRATCEVGGGAGIYDPPVTELARDLIKGKISVPEYNKLVDRILKKPANRWECSGIPLNGSWCGLPDNERVLVRVASRRGAPAPAVRPNSRGRASRGRTSRSLRPNSRSLRPNSRSLRPNSRSLRPNSRSLRPNSRRRTSAGRFYRR
jgi:hypothetical protein